MKVLVALTMALACAAESFAQSGARSANNFSLHPCPGGKGIVETAPMGVQTELYGLVYASQLIVDGTVSTVLPAFNPDPNQLNGIETDSLVLVARTLHGSLPAGAPNYITLAQQGGKAGPCEIVVPADPLVKVGERYVLFLFPDNRKQVANTSGAPRYYAVGLWAGKAKIVDGKIQFLPRAAAGLHMYDNTDAASFIQLVTDWVSALYHNGPAPRYTPPPYPHK